MSGMSMIPCRLSMTRTGVCGESPYRERDCPYGRTISPDCPTINVAVIDASWLNVRPVQRHARGSPRRSRLTRTAARGCRTRAAWAGRTGPSGTRRSSAAAWRPSAIAQTIRLWPRVMSPAVKTLSTLVRLFGVGLDVAHRGRARRRAARACPCARGRRSPSPAGRGRPGRSSRCRGSRRTASGRSSAFISTRTVSSAVDAAVLAEEPLGVDRVLADAPLLVGRGDAEDVRPLRPGVRRRPRRRAGGGRSRTGGRSCSPGGGRCPGSRRRCRRRR